MECLSWTSVPSPGPLKADLRVRLRRGEREALRPRSCLRSRECRRRRRPSSRLLLRSRVRGDRSRRRRCRSRDLERERCRREERSFERDARSRVSPMTANDSSPAVQSTASAVLQTV